MNEKSINMERMHKELDLIQGVIKRMADNSFKVKTWYMGIFGGVIALSKDALFPNASNPINSKSSLAILVLLLFLTILFWYLDTFFLKTELKYIELYKWVVKNRENTGDYLYDLNTFERVTNGKTEIIDENVSWVLGAMFSKTLLPFYIISLIAIIAMLLS